MSSIDSGVMTTRSKRSSGRFMGPINSKLALSVFVLILVRITVTRGYQLATKGCDEYNYSYIVDCVEGSYFGLCKIKTLGDVCHWYGLDNWKAEVCHVYLNRYHDDEFANLSLDSDRGCEEVQEYLARGQSSNIL
ncbi:hypothetical protein [Rochambeau virus]|uniref:Uncharacterized protein n=1 Tax=Rochambeau virus TaxID=380435 RepID=A0A0D3R1A3_9RHAB|nr:hypothetical protein [Rochambeau virus]AJR28504.1 hypothetical protein [Rochambeau virus]